MQRIVIYSSRSLRTEGELFRRAITISRSFRTEGEPFRRAIIMRRDYHRWYSGRVGRDMGVVVYGHWGPPLIMFPTSGGDEWEYERQGTIGAIADLIEGGRVKAFCVNVNHGDSFANYGAHPLHRSWMQRQYDAYIRHEVIPFVRDSCRSDDTGVWTMGASLGGYHAANTLFKYPDVVKRCLALSGVYDMKRFM